MAETNRQTARMFEQITLAQARARPWDAVIAGSSFAAMFFLRVLPARASVLIVERGPILPHADQRSGTDPLEETYAQTNTSGHEKTWTAKRVFGGNSNCWWGQVPRFHPSDFAVHETHGLAAR